MKTALRSWPRHSQITDDNPSFGSEKWISDWAKFNTAAGEVEARKLDEEMMIVRVACDDESHPRTVQAIALAFSFLTGMPATVVAHYVESSRSRSLVVHRPFGRQSVNRFRTPLDPSFAVQPFIEPLLGKATDFFLTELGAEAGTRLYMCLDSLDTTFTTRALIVSAALESIIKLLTRGATERRPLTPEQEGSILVHLEEIDLDEETIGRFKGFFGRMGEISPKNLLRKWATRGVLGVTLDDTRAWTQVRDQVAHGKLLFQGKIAERQKDVTALDRMKVLLVKLLLNAMEYDGEYRDQFAPAPRRFEHVDLSAI